MIPLIFSSPFTLNPNQFAWDDFRDNHTDNSDHSIFNIDSISKLVFLPLPSIS